MHAKRFYNLDGLRFFAAFIVVINHIENTKYHANLSSFHEAPFFQQSATIAVKFFFALSGFLITYLLLLEQQQEAGKRINIKRFYKNRIVRIWPLYYLLIFCTFFIFPHIPLLQYNGYKADFLITHVPSLLLNTFFLPNMALYFQGNIMYTGQLWSLGVEEFFYLFFPLLIYYSTPKTVLKNIMIALSGYAVVAIMYFKWKAAHVVDGSLLQYLFINYQLFVFLFGALAAVAYLRLKDKTWIQTYRNGLKKAAYLLALLTALSIICCFIFPEGKIKLFGYPFLFALLILLLCISNSNIWLLNNRFIIYCGKISYGIYMLHSIVIVICTKLLHINTGNTVINTVLFDAVVAGGTILLSAAVYALIEKPFLRYRQSFAPS